MTADLVARLRGIVAAKPPHVTVLADNAEVYPIRGALLTEVADRLTAAEADMDGWKAQAIEEMDRVEQIATRLAAAERVVEAARAIAPGAAAFLYDSPYHSRYNALLDALDAYHALDAYQKAYSEKPRG